MPARKRTASQTRWLKEHFDDPFVKEAHKRGLRSRASFKLEELQKKDRLIRKRPHYCLRYPADPSYSWSGVLAR